MSRIAVHFAGPEDMADAFACIAQVGADILFRSPRFMVGVDLAGRSPT